MDECKPLKMGLTPPLTVQVPYNGEDGSGEIITAAWKACGTVVQTGFGSVNVALPRANAVTAVPTNSLITRSGDPANAAPINKVRRCMLSASRPVLKAPMVSALETKIWYTAFNLCFQFQLAPLQKAPVVHDHRQALFRGRKQQGHDVGRPLGLHFNFRWRPGCGRGVHGPRVDHEPGCARQRHGQRLVPGLQSCESSLRHRHG